jgi:hypothetical protein
LVGSPAEHKELALLDLDDDLVLVLDSTACRRAPC